MSETSEKPEIRHDEAAGRYEAVLGGEVAGFCEAHRDGDGVTMPHTVVPPRFGGRGIAGDLVRTALDDARAQGLRVRPVCSYVAGWIEKHPEYADLVVR